MANPDRRSRESITKTMRLCKLQVVALDARSRELGKSRDSILLAHADQLLSRANELMRFQAFIEETLWRLESCKDSKVITIGSPATSILSFLSYRMGFEGSLAIVVNAMIDFYLLDPMLESLHRPKDVA